MHSTQYSYSEARIGLYGKFLIIWYIYDLLARGYLSLADASVNILEVNGVLHYRNFYIMHCGTPTTAYHQVLVRVRDTHQNAAIQIKPTIVVI